MQRANGRQKQDAYRFKPRQRDVPISEDEKLSVISKNSSVVSGDDVAGASTSAPKQGNSSKEDLKPKKCDNIQQPIAGPSWRNTSPNLILHDTDHELEWRVQKPRHGRAEKQQDINAVRNNQKGMAKPQDPRPVSTSSRDVVAKTIIDPSTIELEEETKNSSNQANPVNSKKKKKKKLNKTERQQKREGAALNDLYKPKDTHVNVLSSELFQKFKFGIETTTRVSSSTPYIRPGSIRDIISPIVAQSSSVSEFPLLSTSTYANSLKTPKFKSFSEVSSPLQVPQLSSATASPKIEAATSSDTPSVATLPANDQDTKDKKLKWSQRPITFNIRDAIKSPVSVITSVANKQIAKKSKHDNLSAIRENPKLTVGNLLDASGPIVFNRGKIKEKKKKPSKLKKSILQAREQRKTVLTSFAFTLNCAIESVESETLKSETSSLAPSPSSNCTIEPQSNQTNSKDTNENLNPNFDNPFKALLDEAEESAKLAPIVPKAIIDLVKLQMHSRKFRPYCDMYATKELHGLVIPMMNELHRLQDRIYKTDPMKLKTKRRFVNGIKEAINSLKLNKVQLVILAPDIESNGGEGGLDCKITEIISLAEEKKIPLIFSGNRFILGKCIKQTKSPVSVIAVLDKQSVEEQFNKVLEMAESQRQQYKNEFDRRVQELVVQ